MNNLATTPLRAAIYIRVSKDDGTRNPENQLPALEEFARRSGWPIVQIYRDEATGTRADRDQFQAMLLAASQRKFDVLLFWSLDRFGREGVLPTLQHLQKLDGWGVQCRSYMEPWLDTTGPMRDVLVAFVAAIAKMERDRISERTKAGLRRVRREGRILGRPRVKLKAVEIRQRQAEGKSLRTIAAETGVSLSSIVRVLKQAA